MHLRRAPSLSSTKLGLSSAVTRAPPFWRVPLFLTLRDDDTRLSFRADIRLPWHQFLCGLIHPSRQQFTSSKRSLLMLLVGTGGRQGYEHNARSRGDVLNH